mmetsp:Transcript_23475/g.79587  ORF Transcript_23475/g.79587 Transcript_23475/m.79587 type:complete len:301 (-) Transcript_23475:35-937(-)
MVWRPRMNVATPTRSKTHAKPNAAGTGPKSTNIRTMPEVKPPMELAAMTVRGNRPKNLGKSTPNNTCGPNPFASGTLACAEPALCRTSAETAALPIGQHSSSNMLKAQLSVVSSAIRHNTIGMANAMMRPIATEVPVATKRHSRTNSGNKPCSKAPRNAAREKPSMTRPPINCHNTCLTLPVLTSLAMVWAADWPFGLASSFSQSSNACFATTSEEKLGSSWGQSASLKVPRCIFQMTPPIQSKLRRESQERGGTIGVHAIKPGGPWPCAPAAPLFDAEATPPVDAPAIARALTPGRGAP